MKILKGQKKNLKVKNLSQIKSRHTVRQINWKNSLNWKLDRNIEIVFCLQRLCEKFNKTSTQALVNAVAKVQQRGDISKAQGEGNW